jgi:hypothetical protein
MGDFVCIGYSGRRWLASGTFRFMFFVVLDFGVATGIRGSQHSLDGNYGVCVVLLSFYDTLAIGK